MELSEGHPLSAIYVDLDAMTITLVNGDTVPITTLFDSDGEECEPEDAIVAVGGSDASGWWTIPLPEPGETTLH